MPFRTNKFIKPENQWNKLKQLERERGRARANKKLDKNLTKYRGARAAVGEHSIRSDSIERARHFINPAARI